MQSPLGPVWPCARYRGPPVFFTWSSCFLQSPRILANTTGCLNGSPGFTASSRTLRSSVDHSPSSVRSAFAGQMVSTATSSVRAGRVSSLEHAPDITQTCVPAVIIPPCVSRRSWRVVHVLPRSTQVLIYGSSLGSLGFRPPLRVYLS